MYNCLKIFGIYKCKKKIMDLKKIENIVNIIFLFESFNIFIILISKLLKEV